LEIAQNSMGNFLYQIKHALGIISIISMLGVKLVAFPLNQNHDLPLANTTS